LEDTDSSEYCSKCNGILSEGSNFCEKCGWPKNRRMVSYEADQEKIADSIESSLSPKKPTLSEIKNEKKCPTGIIILAVISMVIGISLIALTIIVGSLIMLAVLGGAMNNLMSIGSMQSAPFLPEMDNSIQTITPYLDMFNEIPGMEGLPRTSEIADMMTNSMVDMNMESIMMMEMMTVIFGSIVVILGVVYFSVGSALLKGKKWARTAVIVLIILSLATTFFAREEMLFIVIGSLAFDSFILYYLYRPHVKEFFTNTMTEKTT